MVPGAAEHLPASRRARAPRLAGAVWRAALMLLARKAIRRPSGAVARRARSPRPGSMRHRRAAAAGDVDLGQRVAVVEALLRRRVEDEGDVPAVGRDVEDVRRPGRQRCSSRSRALEQVAHAAAGDVEHVQVGDAAHRQVVVPVAVLRLAGDVAAFLALLEFLPALGLRLGALQLGPDPGDEGDALAVGEPLEGLDAGREVADAARLAAVRRDQVELRGLVLLALPARAWRRRRSRSPLGRPGGLAVLLAAGGEAARRRRRRWRAARGWSRPCCPPSSGWSPSRRPGRRRARGETAPTRSICHSVFDVDQLDLALRHSSARLVVVVGAARLNRSMPASSAGAPYLRPFAGGDAVHHGVAHACRRGAARGGAACRRAGRRGARSRAGSAKLKLSVRSSTSYAAERLERMGHAAAACTRC